jgi:lipopolysaccharide transport system ATP-binding protein
MSQPPAVTVQNLSKMYLLYKKPQDRLKQSLLHRFGRNYARTFWALQDVSFEVGRGKTLGIIGRNGSGKSTLLQIVCGTLQPTTGFTRVNGRVTALLELGAGFNPDFTGRENIFLNGATLEIPNSEMRRRLQQILDFAQIGEFIDQPVKIYSSGMYVRLAFAIATSVDPDLLVIDEALAVGDAGFVIKCMNRMKQLRSNGTTILLVTHDVYTARSICDEILWLDQGRPREYGSPNDVSSHYMQFLFEDRAAASLSDASTLSGLQSGQAPALTNFQTGPARPLLGFEGRTDLIRWGNGRLLISGFTVCGANGVYSTAYEYNQPAHIEFEIAAQEDVPSDSLGVAFSLRNTRGLDLITSTTYDEGLRLPPMRKGQKLRFGFDLNLILAHGDYALVLNIEDRQEATPSYYDFIENAAILQVVPRKLIFSLMLPPVEQRVWIPEG